MRCFLLFFIIILGACVPAQKFPTPTLQAPLRQPTEVEDKTSTLTETKSQTLVEQGPQFQETPKAPRITQSIVQLTEEGYQPSFNNQAPVSVNLEGIPLPAFINEVFGSLLGLSFDMMPQIQSRQELITLRATESQSPKQLYILAQQVLANYGVTIQKLRGENFIRFIPSTQQATPPSLLISGSTLPHVPPSHRPIFQFVPIKVVKSAQIVPWIQKIYQGHDLEVMQDENRNAIMLLGPASLVGNALEVIKLLDQPLMRGQHSLRIEPSFLSASELATQLTEVLKNEGIAVGHGGVSLLPLDKTNALIVFAIDQQQLLHIQQWTEQLDRLNPRAGERGLFLYTVKNTAAEPLAGTLNDLLKTVIADPIEMAQVTNAETKPSTPTLRNDTKLVVDKHRNALIFTGTSEEWARLLPILHDMDQPVKQVLIEATIAEIKLTDNDKRGIDWIVNRADVLSSNADRLTIGDAGLIFSLTSAGKVRATLEALASSERITILQTPRLLVRSGSSATMTVGDEVPTLTSQAASTDTDSEVLQQVQYRSTGITLNITPTVYAGRYIDLQVSQTLSKSQGSAGKISSPVIFNRQITTELSLSDGNSVLLGGLISNDHSEGWTGVPILSEIPILGQLFRVEEKTSERTELIVLIIPYIIGNEREAQAITETVKSRLELLPLGITGIHEYED